MIRFLRLLSLAGLAALWSCKVPDTGTSSGMTSCYDTGGDIACVPTDGIGPQSKDVNGDGVLDRLTCANGDEDGDAQGEQGGEDSEDGDTAGDEDGAGDQDDGASQPGDDDGADDADDDDADGDSDSNEAGENCTSPDGDSDEDGVPDTLDCDCD